VTLTLAARDVAVAGAGGAAGHSTAAQHSVWRAGRAVAALDVACAVLIVQRLDGTLCFVSCHQDGMGLPTCLFIN